MSSEVKVKKIKPYPFACILSKNSEVFHTAIVQVEALGFYIEDDKIQWSPSDRCIVGFVLPVRNVRIKSHAMLVKVTNSLMPDPTKKLHKRLAFQFMDLPLTASKQIKLFCEAIGQQ